MPAKRSSPAKAAASTPTTTSTTTSTTPEQVKALLVAPKRPQRVGVVGATGAVGKEMLTVLRRRGWPLAEVRAFASERSANTSVKLDDGSEYPVEVFSMERTKDLDVVFLAVSGEFATENARKMAAGGPLVIDNSSALRYDADVPLVVPEVNGVSQLASPDVKLVANPNCTTAIAIMALHPLHEKFGLRKVIVSTYQAASGAGVPGMDELEAQTKAWAAGKQPDAPKTFPYPLALNLIPQIDKFQDNGYTKEEMKVAWETRKIMSLPDLPVSCTAVRIPILRAHSEAVTIETAKPISADAAREVLATAVGVRLVDEPAKLAYPMPLNATKSDDVEVGRVRQSLVFGDHGLDFFVSGDQLLRGAALNAVLIAEMAFSLREASSASSSSPEKKPRSD